MVRCGEEGLNLEVGPLVGVDLWPLDARLFRSGDTALVSATPTRQSVPGSGRKEEEGRQKGGARRT